MSSLLAYTWLSLWAILSSAVEHNARDVVLGSQQGISAWERVTSAFSTAAVGANSGHSAAERSGNRVAGGNGWSGWAAQARFGHLLMQMMAAQRLFIKCMLSAARSSTFHQQLHIAL